MEGRIADPKALGFGAFAIGAWMYSMIDAGWFAMSTLGSGTLQAVNSFAAVALLIAAIAAFLRDDGWHALFFGFWAAVFWGLGGILETGPGDPMFAGWHSLMIAVFSILLLMSARSSDVGPAAATVAGGLTLAFVCFAAGNMFGLEPVYMAGGYVGLVTAAAAIWAASGAMPGGAVASAGVQATAASTERASGMA